eukprot:Skav213075  [mRNA]  locus=scaffold3042:14551:16130:+ [translate_table: standard]
MVDINVFDGRGASISEAKFRHLKMSNAALKTKVALGTKVFDVPGALDFLRAAGFQEDGEALDARQLAELLSHQRW